MNLTDAALKARALMNHHGLGHIPFEFDRGRKRIGGCHYTPDGEKVTRITVSHHYAALMGESELVNTILHEIAHAITHSKYGYGQHHNHLWQAEARALGIAGDRCTEVENSPEAAWTAKCRAGHGLSTAFHRAPLRIRSCNQCDPNFNSNYIIDWYKNGRLVSVNQMPVRYQNEYNRYVRV